MGDSGARVRRTAVVYLLLSLTGVAGALWLAHEHHLGTAATAVSLLPSLAGMYMTWASFRADRTEAAAERGLGEVADLLATVVREQWESEARVRRLNDPYPLPVSWVPADARLVEDWPLLLSTAAGWPGGPPSDPESWATEPGGLTGSDGEIADVLLRRVPTRRLVVLGAPGSGKTMLLVRMLLALVEQRQPGGPVPVLFPLASWNPAEQELDAWLAERMIQDYPGLRDPVLSSLEPMTHAQALLTGRLILPILDGFDEISQAVRGTALDKINAALRLGQGLVLSSRVEEYRGALAPESAVPVKLAGAAGIELQPLAPAVAAAYLTRDAGGRETASAARWETVLARMPSGETPIAQALGTPLMLFLARTIYNPRPGEGSVTLPNPAELCDEDRFPDRSAVEAHLFDAFIPAAYRPHPRYPCKWRPEQAEKAFVHLARHLQHSLSGTADLAWWQLHRTLPLWVWQITCGVLAGGADWLAGGAIAALGHRIPAGSMVSGYSSFLDTWLVTSSGGLVGGLAGGLVGRLPGGLVGGLVGGLAQGLTYEYAGQGDTEAGFLGSIVTGLAYGFVGGLMGELVGRSSATGLMMEESVRERWLWRWGVAATGMAVGIAYTTANGLEYTGFGIPVKLAVACVFGLAGGLVGVRSPRRQETPPMIRVRLAWDRGALAAGLAGLTIGLLPWLSGILSGELLGGGYSSFSAIRASTPFTYAFAGAIAYGLKAAPANLTSAVGPATLLAQDRRTFSSLWFTVTVAITVVAGLTMVAEPTADVGGNLYWGAQDNSNFADAQILAPLLGLAGGAAVALARTAIGFFTLVRGYAALRRRLPYNLMTFLADAHERRGVLRQAGAVYEFRHIDLQHRLAERP